MNKEPPIKLSADLLAESLQVEGSGMITLKVLGKKKNQLPTKTLY